MAGHDLLLGSSKDRNYKYLIDSRGLFIVVENNDFEYQFEVEGIRHDVKKTAEEKDGRFATKFITTSLDNIRSTLRLRLGENLIENKFLSIECSRDESDRFTEEPFVKFIKEIARKVRSMDRKPSFLMFILVSAGMEFGQFLLAGNQTPCDASCVVEQQYKHQYTKRCQARRVSDLVRAIQEAKDADGALFSGIPKIFLIQTVSDKDHVKVTDKPGGKPEKAKEKLKADDYTPRGSDTFVFYAHTEKRVDWVNEKGFYLLDKFCDAVKDCEKSDKSTKASRMLRSLSTIWKDPDVTVDDEDDPHSLLQSVNNSLVKEFRHLELASESLVGSWFDNVCTATSTNITNFLKAEEKKENGYNHLRAHMSSTLRYRLSVTDMLKSQPDVDTNNDK